MFKPLIALSAALGLAAAPAAAATTSTAALSVATATQDGGASDGFFGTPEATVGVVIFSLITVFGILVAAGVFDDDDDRSVSA